MKCQISNVKFQMSNVLVPVVVLVIGLTLVPSVFAHVTVKPNEVGVGARTNFVVSVPTEEDVPTTQVRLVIPEGVKSVRPNVKPGWNIELKKVGEGENAVVNEIIWSGGSVPVEQRDEFVFSAQAPSNEGTLNWKAYQRYASGMVVAWDADPKTVEEYIKNHPAAAGEDDHNAAKPWSETKVIDDLLVSAAPALAFGDQVTKDNTPLYFSMAALLLACATLGIALRKK